MKKFWVNQTGHTVPSTLSRNPKFKIVNNIKIVHSEACILPYYPNRINIIIYKLNTWIHYWYKQVNDCIFV